MTIREASRNYHHGQSDMTIYAEDGNQILGYCDYSVYRNVARVEMIEVKPEYRNQKVATTLLNYLYDKYPNVELGYSTDDGSNFLKKYKKPYNEKHLIYRFLQELEEYQSNHYGNYNRQELVDAYRQLPMTIKKYLAAKNLQNLYRGCDGLTEKPAISFTDKKSNAFIYGSFAIPFSMVKSYDAAISSEKACELNEKINTDLSIGDDENEVIVLNAKWKNFDISKFHERAIESIEYEDSVYRYRNGRYNPDTIESTTKYYYHLLEKLDKFVNDVAIVSTYYLDFKMNDDDTYYYALISNERINELKLNKYFVKTGSLFSTNSIKIDHLFREIATVPEKVRNKIKRLIRFEHTDENLYNERLTEIWKIALNYDPSLNLKCPDKILKQLKPNFAGIKNIGILESKKSEFEFENPDHINFELLDRLKYYYRLFKEMNQFVKNLMISSASTTCFDVGNFGRQRKYELSIHPENNEMKLSKIGVGSMPNHYWENIKIDTIIREISQNDKIREIKLWKIAIDYDPALKLECPTDVLKKLKYINLAKVKDIGVFENMDSTQIHQEIVNTKSKKVKILIDTKESLVIQTNDADLIERYGKHKLLPDIEDDYVLHFLAFNFVSTKKMGNVYQIGISLKSLKYEAMDETGTRVKMSQVDEACHLPKDFLKNYVATIVENLNNEIRTHHVTFSKLLKKYKNYKPLTQYICDKVVEHFKKKNLKKEELLSTLVDIVNQSSDVDLSKILDKEMLHRLINFKLSSQDIITYQKPLYKLIDSKLDIDWPVLFQEDVVFVNFTEHLNKNVSNDSYDKFIRSFRNDLSLEKLNAMNDASVEFFLTTDSCIDKILTIDVKNFENLRRILISFFEKDLKKLNISVGFLLKNKDTLNISDKGLSDLVTLIYQQLDKLKDYASDLKKLHELGTSFMMQIRKNVSDFYFNKFVYRKLNKDIASTYCKIFIDACNFKNKNAKTCLIEGDYIHDFVIKKEINGINKDVVDNFKASIQKLDLSEQDVVSMFYEKDKIFDRIKLIQELKLANIKESELKKDQNFALQFVDKCDKDFQITNEALDEICQSLNISYDKNQQAFVLKISKLDELKPIVIYDEDENFSLDDNENFKIENIDYEHYRNMVSKANLKLLNNDSEQKFKQTVDSVVSDYFHKRILNIIFEKMFNSGYFKKWKDGRNYKIIDQKFTILMTDKFIVKSLQKWAKLQLTNEPNNIDIFESIIMLLEHKSFVNFQKEDFNLNAINQKHFNQVLSNQL